MERNENTAEISGFITSPFEFNNECNGEKFYRATVAVKRQSGNTDEVPILVSGNMLASDDYSGHFVYITGNIRTYNQSNENGTKKLFIYLFCRTLEVDADVVEGINKITLRGFLCKDAVRRDTPLGRQITDILLACNRPYGKTDYIPTILWGRNARVSGDLKTGSELEILGRFQSREYIKGSTGECKTAYEVSATSLNIVNRQ